MGMPPPPPGGVADAPYSPQPASGGGVKALLIALLVLGVLALIALVVVGAFLVLDDEDDGDAETTTTVVSPSDADGQGQDPTDAGSAPALSEPTDAVEEGIQLAQADDCDAAEALMTAELAADQPCASPEWQMLASGAVEYDVLSSEVDDDGDEASVVVAFTDDSGTSDYEFDLEMVDGAWLIDSVEPERG